MSQLGNYVHHSWSRYLKYGITENEEQGVNPSQIFQQHHTSLMMMIERWNDLDIKKIETDFNDLTQQTYKKLVSYLKSDSSGAIMRSLLKLINKSLTDTDVDRIAQGIKIKEESRTLVYEPKDGNAAVKSEKSIGIKKLGDGQHYYSTCLDRLEKIIGKIESLELNVSDYNADIDAIKTQMDSWKAAQGILTPIEKGNRQKNTLMPNGHPVYSLINTLITKLQGVATISQIIQQQLAEIIGQAAVNGISSLVNDELNDLSVQMKNILTGQKKTSTTGVSIDCTFDLDQKWLKAEYQKDNSIYKGQIVQNDATMKEDISYSFKQVASEVQQKVDIEWQGVASISMKNTAFDNDWAPDDIIPSISAQSSALRLYLEGLEASQAGLGTHYLNVLASHSKKNGTKNLQKISREARESLLLYMLYSALTGEGQNRRSDSFANVLAIWDKKKKGGAQQVKLFSMKDILKKLAPNILSYDGQISIPALTSFNLENRFIGKQKSQDEARTRITKLLAEASIKKVAIKVPKNLLKSLQVKYD